MHEVGCHFLFSAVPIQWGQIEVNCLKCQQLPVSILYLSRSINTSVNVLFILTNSLEANLNFVGNQTISIPKITGREMGTRQYRLLPWTEVEDWKIIVDFRSPLFYPPYFCLSATNKSTEINKHCLIGSKISIGILYLIVTQDKDLDHLVEWK